jgi:hypothetical protein
MIVKNTNILNLIISQNTTARKGLKKPAVFLPKMKLKIVKLFTAAP